MKSFKQFVSDLSAYTDIPSDKLPGHVRAGKRPYLVAKTHAEVMNVIKKNFVSDVAEIPKKTTLIAMITDVERGGHHTVWYDTNSGHAYIPMTNLIGPGKYENINYKTKDSIDPIQLVLAMQKTLGQTGKFDIRM